MARALVVSHIAVDGAGALGDWLPAAGLDLDVIQSDTDAVPARLPDGFDALILMGGTPNVDEDHEWLVREKELARSSVLGGTPTLGICLGAQVIADACGGVVARGPAGPEIGVGRVFLRPEAAEDVLLAELPPIVDVVQWHWYGVERLPPGAVWLGASPTYPYQAFRVGDRAWGLQFHPEAPPHQVRQWAVEDAELIRFEDMDPERIGAEAAVVAGEAETLWRPVFARFAEVTRAVRGARTII